MRQHPGQERLGALVLRVVEDISRLAFFHNLPLMNVDHPICHFSGKARFVGD